MGCRHESLDIVTQIYDHTLFLHASDRTGGLDARRKALRNLRPRIIGQLFDPERDPLRLRIDIQHQHLDLVALLDDLGGMLHSPGPTQIRDVHQAVDPRLDFDERAERGEVSDHSGQLGAGGVFGRQREPGVFFDLLHAERDLLVLHIHLQDHRLDLIADVHELGGVANVTRPRHLGDMNEALDPLLQLDEGSVVGDRYDLSTHPRAHRIFLVDVGPRVGKKLLEAQGNSFAVPIDVENLHVEIGTDIHDLGGMSDPPPGHVGDMEKAVEPTQIDKGAEVGDILDDPLSDLPDKELLDQRLAFSFALSLEDDAPRDHDVTAALVELDDFEFEGLSEEVVDVRYPAKRNLRAGKEGVDTHDIYRDTALDLPRQHSFDRLIGLMSFPNLLPDTQEVGLLFRKHDDPVIVLEAFEKNLNLLARLDRVMVLELIERDRAFALEPELEDDHAVRHPEHLRVDDLAFSEVTHHIRVIGEQGLEIRRRYVENFLPVRIRQQLGRDAAGPFLGYRHRGLGGRGRGLPIRRVVAGSGVIAVVQGGCFRRAVFGFVLSGGFGGGIGGLEVWVVGHGSFTGEFHRCLFYRARQQRPGPG